MTDRDRRNRLVELSIFTVSALALVASYLVVVRVDRQQARAAKLVDLSRSPGPPTEHRSVQATSPTPTRAVNETIERRGQRASEKERREAAPDRRSRAPARTSPDREPPVRGAVRAPRRKVRRVIIRRTRPS